MVTLLMRPAFTSLMNEEYVVLCVSCCGAGLKLLNTDINTTAITAQITRFFTRPFKMPPRYR
jgi:hypothetical protein